MEEKQSMKKILEYQQEIHEKNQKRIKYGIRCVLIIPFLFMAVMFALDSNKVVFLVLWIVTLFAISIYLIVVEYRDDQTQRKLVELGLQQEEAVKELLAEEPQPDKPGLKEPRKDAQAYVEMRRARALKKQEREQQ